MVSSQVIQIVYVGKSVVKLTFGTVLVLRAVLHDPKSVIFYVFAIK